VTVTTRNGKPLQESRHLVESAVMQLGLARRTVTVSGFDRTAQDRELADLTRAGGPGCKRR
jgi:hypothetical protein